MPSEISRPLLLGGERLQVKIQKTGRKPPKKTHLHTYEEAQTRLLPQIDLAIETLSSPQTLRTKEAVLRATMWPEYLAASHFPTVLLEKCGIRVVGNEPALGETKRREEVVSNALARTVFLAASDTDLAALRKLVAGPVPKNDEDRLWNGVRTLASISVSSSDTTFTDRAGVSEGSEAVRLWECVLHETADINLAIQQFISLVNANGGEANMRNVLRVPGLTYLSASMTTVVAKAVAGFNPLRAVRPMPSIRPLASSFRSVASAKASPPLRFAPRTDRRVAVFDGGIAKGDTFIGSAARLIDLSSAPAEADGITHGTIVTNALLAGYIAAGEAPRAPDVTVDHYRVWPPPRAHASDADLFWVLKNISETVRREKYRVAVLCLAPDQEVDDETLHPWTATLDSLARETGTLFIVAAGNGGEHPRETGLHRVQVPADMVNGIGVGACTHRLRDAKNFARAPYSSSGPGRAGAVAQPMLLQFGGTKELPFVGIARDGVRTETAGTSFAAPLVGHAVAGAFAAMGEEVGTAATLRALAVHSAQASRPHRLHDHGFGRALERFDSVWECAPHTATLIYSERLLRMQPMGFQIPVPSGLDPNMELSLRLTAAYQSPVDPSSSLDYTLAGLEWHFRPNISLFTFTHGNSKTQKVDTRDVARVASLKKGGWKQSKAPVTKTLRKKAFHEEERRSIEHKWETVLQATAKATAAALVQPRLELSYLARDEGHLLSAAQSEPLTFSMVVTIEAPKGVDLYGQIREQFKVLTPIQLDTRVFV